MADTTCTGNFFEMSSGAATPPEMRGREPDVVVDARTPVKLVTRAFMRDPYPALRSLRERTPAAVRMEKNGFLIWVITRFDDVRRVLGDRSFGKDIPKGYKQVAATNLVRPERQITLPRKIRRGFVDRDGDDHQRLRSLVSGDFRAHQIAELRPKVEEITDALLDDLPRGQPTDLVPRFSRPLAISVISELLGVPPHQRHGFSDAENALFTSMTPEEVAEAGRQILDFCRRMIALKRAEPGDDIFTKLVRAEREGKLDEEELMGVYANLMIGGMEASTPIASGVALLLTHRDQLSRLLADPGLLPDCIEEILRYESPFRILAPRFSTNDFAIDGLTIPAGELVAPCVAAASRDPRQYTDSDTFDITRKRVPSLVFGHGPHHCLGIHLGRLQTSVALESLLRRFPHSRLTTSWQDLQWCPGTWMRRLASLPVILR